VPPRGAGWEPDSLESELNNPSSAQRSTSNLYGCDIRFARVVLPLLWTMKNFHCRHRAHFFLHSTTTNCLFPAQTATRDLLLPAIRSYPIVRSLFYPLDSTRLIRTLLAYEDRQIINADFQHSTAFPAHSPLHAYKEKVTNNSFTINRP
jgi:hypothetical protein